MRSQARSMEVVYLLLMVDIFCNVLYFVYCLTYSTQNCHTGSSFSVRVQDELRCWACAWVLQLCCCAGRWCRLPSSSPSRIVAWKLLLLLRWVLWLPWQAPCQLRPWRARLLAQTCAPSLWSTWSTHCATLSSWCARSTTSHWSWASSRHWSPSSTWSCLRLSQMRTSEWDRLGHLKAKVFQSPYSAVLCEGRKKTRCSWCGVRVKFEDRSRSRYRSLWFSPVCVHVSKGLKSLWVYRYWLGRFFGSKIVL